MVDWQLQCEMLERQGTHRAPIRIELMNGLTVTGDVDVRDARQVFREPYSLAPMDRPILDAEIVVALPASKLLHFEFPANR